jgi:hypothetical protein
MPITYSTHRNSGTTADSASLRTGFHAGTRIRRSQIGVAMAESDELIHAHMQELFRSELAILREKVVAAQAAGALAPGATAEGVTWLFTALGMLTDATVALDLPEGLAGGLESAATLFWQSVSRGTYKVC